MPQPQPYQQSDGRGNEPRDDLDVAFSIIRSSEYNELLEQINFGTGYYGDEELRMQMRNIRKGLVTDIAFTETLRKYAEQETKVKLADEGFQFYHPDKEEVHVWRSLAEIQSGKTDIGGEFGKSYTDKSDGETWTDRLEEKGRTTVLQERGEAIWQDLSRPAYSLSVEQAAAMDAKTKMNAFKPIFNHLAAIFHEQTKSKGARTQDNYFGRVRRQVLQGEGDNEAARKLLGGSS